MKKISVLLFTVFLTIASFSCAPQTLDDEAISENIEATGGDDGQTPHEEEDPSTGIGG